MKDKFWTYFDTEAAPRLGKREETFRKIFEHLDGIIGTIRIVETGCARVKDNWAGDGQSTVLFDKYISNRDNTSICLTVDISENSVRECSLMVSQRVKIYQQDSVSFLATLSKQLESTKDTIDFLYLDSFDLDMKYWQPSAIHHLKELTAASRVLRSDTLVVVDDCPSNADFIYQNNSTIGFVTPPTVGGKGRLVSEYADSVGATCIFAKYQAGWTNMA